MFEEDVQVLTAVNQRFTRKDYMSDFNDLTLSDLNLIAQLPNFRSIRALANHVEISAAAVSKKIKSIENKLSFELLNRSSMGISSTNEGLLSAKWANEIIHQSATLPNKLKDLNKKSS